MLQWIFMGLVLLAMVAILWLFIAKAGLQLKYLRLKKGQKPLSGGFLSFNFNDPKARQERWEAFLLFPMLYPVVLDDDKEELNQIKVKVKRIHIGIYAMLIILVVLGIYSEKVFPS